MAHLQSDQAPQCASRVSGAVGSIIHIPADSRTKDTRISPLSSASPRGSHSSKAHPVPQIPPSLLTPPSLPVIPLNSLMPAIPLVNFIECGCDFAITNPDDINETCLVACDQLCTLKALSDCCSRNHSLDVRSTMLLVRQNVGSCCT